MLKLSFFALAMVVGQLIFKRVAQDLDDEAGFALLRAIASDPWFITGVVLYACATFLWILALRETPLSRAYMFVVIAIALVPIGAAIFYQEPLGTRYLAGLCLVMAGVALIGSGGKNDISLRTDVDATR